MDKNVTKVTITEEFLEENKDILTEFTDLKIGDEIEIEKADELIVHPILLLEKDNFVFKTPDMDVTFFSMMYRLYMRLVPLTQTFPDEEFNQLLQVYNHFLNSIVNTCAVDGHIDPIKSSELENVFKRYEEKIMEQIKSEIKEETKEN